jgi:squalene-hopene/tetraprenyl-beta-curcumene cyclase
MFAEAFPEISDDVVLDLGRAAQMCARSLIVADKIMDADDAIPTSRLTLGLLALQYETYARLTPLFPQQSPFWSNYDRYYGRVIGAILTEQSLKGAEVKVEPAEMLTLAADKNALHSGIAAAFCCLSGRDDRLADMEESLGAFSIATQIVDDVHDWKIDLATGTPSTLNTRGAVLGRYMSKTISIEEAASALFGDRHVSDALALALEHFQSAQSSASRHGLTRWGRFLASRERAAADFLHQIDAARHRQREWVSEVADVTIDLDASIEEPIGTLIEGIASSWRTGFPELQHLMRFPRAGGFSGTTELKRGDVFQRALMLDTLQTCKDRLHTSSLDSIIRAERAYLMNAGELDPSGHRVWKYFLDLPELPPDLDDLAEMLRLTNRSTELSAIRSDLNWLVASVSHSKAGIPDTWIIPRDSRDPLHVAQRHHSETNWGRTNDVEVVANFADALATYDPAALGRYSDLPEYFIANLSSDGFWRSTWYEGPFYGTYVVLRALRHYPDAPAQKLAIDACSRALRDSFTAIGWGLHAGPDRTSTALALLALDALRTLGASHDERHVLSARRFLSAPREDGAPLVPFIKMTVSTTPPSVLTYQSRTLEDGLTLRALLAWRAV